MNKPTNFRGLVNARKQQHITQNKNKIRKRIFLELFEFEVNCGWQAGPWKPTPSYHNNKKVFGFGIKKVNNTDEFSIKIGDLFPFFYPEIFAIFGWVTSQKVKALGNNNNNNNKWKVEKERKTARLSSFELKPKLEMVFWSFSVSGLWFWMTRMILETWLFFSFLRLVWKNERIVQIIHVAKLRKFSKVFI